MGEAKRRREAGEMSYPLMDRKQLAELWRLENERDSGGIVHCPFCGIMYLKGGGDRLDHARFHRQYASTLPPRPDKRITVPEGDLIVDINSPRWMHRMVYERARRLRREEGYDTTQWRPDHAPWDPETEPDPPHAILLIEGGDTAVGTVAFSYGKHWDNVPEGWFMVFAWVAPEWRRKGVLSRRWSAWREQYGAFMLEPPLSNAMKAFAAKHNHSTIIPIIEKV